MLKKKWLIMQEIDTINKLLHKIANRANQNNDNETLNDVIDISCLLCDVCNKLNIKSKNYIAV